MKRVLIYLWNFWPPFIGAGIRIQKITPNFREVTTVLKKRPWTANYVGIQYGGSIFSMVDPFYMVMLIENLGREFSVMDKGAEIRFLKPGKTALTATFKLTDEDLDQIRGALKSGEKMEWSRVIEVQDRTGVTVATVNKIISIKRK